MKNNKKIISLLIITFVILIGIVLICSVSGVFDSDNILFGNNSIASYYVMGIGDTKYDDLQKALKEKDKNYTNEVTIGNITIGNVIIVLQKGIDDIQGHQSNYVNGYEFILKQGYYYSGKKKVTIDGFKDKSHFNWIDTIRADLGETTCKSYRKLSKRYAALPAWGISDNKNVQNVTIDGQEIDQTISIDANGKEYYLWIIKDLQTKNHAKEIQIEEKAISEH